MLWNKVTITFAPTRYQQNYKRSQASHSHELAQKFTVDAMQESLRRINAHLPPNQPAAQQNQLGIANQASDLPSDPGLQWQLI
jgi:hypothetical protein